jgi:hypothetical protein
VVGERGEPLELIEERLPAALRLSHESVRG